MDLECKVEHVVEGTQRERLKKRLSYNRCRRWDLLQSERHTMLNRGFEQEGDAPSLTMATKLPTGLGEPGSCHPRTSAASAVTQAEQGSCLQSLLDCKRSEFHRRSSGSWSCDSWKGVEQHTFACIGN